MGLKGAMTRDSRKIGVEMLAQNYVPTQVSTSCPEGHFELSRFVIIARISPIFSTFLSSLGEVSIRFG